MKPENRARITTQVLPWVAGAAAEARLGDPWHERFPTGHIGSSSSYQAMR